jgi:hypothetical protein
MVLNVTNVKLETEMKETQKTQTKLHKMIVINLSLNLEFLLLNIILQ